MDENLQSNRNKQYKTWDGKNWDGRLFRDEQKKYTVYLPKYGITVRTGLTDAREISYQTEIKALKQSRDMYFALGRLGESRRDFTEGIFKQAAKATGNFVVSSSANLYGWGKDWLWKGYNEHKKGSAERQKFTEMLNKEYQPSYTYEPLKDAQERYNSAIEKVKNSEEYKQFLKENEQKFAEAEKAREDWNIRQRKDLDDFIQKAGLDKNQFDGFTYDLVGGGASAVAALAVGVITKSPAAVAAVFGASAGHEYYTEALAAGLNGNKAMAVGYGAGALEGFLELFGAEGLYRAAVRAKPFKHSINAIIRNARIKLKKQGLKKMGLDMGTAALQGAAVEGSEEFVQDISTAAIMNAAGVRNDEARQVIIDAFYSAALGAITGGALAGGGRGGIRMLAYMQKQSIANKLEQAGFDKENAKEIAAEIIDKGYSKQTTDAFIKFAESENSPLTYPNADKEAAAKAFGVQVKELADPAKRAAAAKEIWDIYDKVKADALNAGLPAMWAEFAANRAKHFAAQAAEYVGVMPKEWYEKNKITFMNSMRTDWERAGKPESVSYKNTMDVDTRLQPSGMTADGGQKEDLELALKNERFNQPLLNTVDTTQQVNVVDLSSFRFTNTKPVKDQIKDKLKQLSQNGPLSTATKNILADVLNKKISHIQNSSKYIFLLQHKDNKKRHDKNVFNLDNLMQNAVLVAIAPNVKKQNKPNVENYYYFYVPVRYGNDVFVVQIAAEENVNEAGIDPKTVHIYDVLEIKKVRSGNLANDISKNKSSLPNTISIEDLLTNVKDYKKQDYILKPVINVNGKQLGTRNSDGRQIAHTPQDIANFWEWFGDSKVVDENGKPLVVYHGSPTSEKFNVFDKTKIGQRDEGDFGKLFYFTPDADYAKSYALTTGVNTFYSDRNVKNGQVYPVYIKMDNPRYVSKLDSGTIDEEKLKGYDGIILYESFDLRNDPKELERIKKEITNESYLVRDFEDNIIGYRKMVEVGVKEPAQIKSVYNRGTFDFNDSNIFFQQQDNQQAVDLTAEFANIKGLTAQNAQQLIEQELNKVIGKPLDTATTPLQIQITSGNKVHIKRPNVPLKGGQLVRHQAVLSALEKVVNKAVKTDKDGTVDLTHNTSKRTLTHKAGVDKYVYFKAPVQAEITDENGQKSTVYFEVELAAEQVKGQDPNLLDLYNVRVKKSSPHTHLSAFAGNTNSITNNGQNDNSFNQDDVIGARGYVEFSTQGAFMHLLENADPSTILHETSGHIQLRNMEQMRDLAETQGATEEFWDIWQGLEKWLGKAQRIENPDGTVKYRFTTEQQEMFAEGMEKMYIAGKAPTTALQKIFEYFKQMLSTMYEEAREWLDLRPEVEQLFEKILAGPQVENADSKLYKGRAKDIKAVAEKARNGESATINGMGIKEVKALLKQLSKRRPALPKDDLYTVLKRKGADYANAAQIDKEAYENAGIKNKKDGIGDKLALWLKEEGFLFFDEDNGNYRDDSDMEAKAADMIDRALSGEKIYRIEDQEKAEQAENFDANMEAIREAFGNNVEQAEQTLRAIEDLQAKGYRVIGNSDVEYAEEESEKLMSFAEKEKQFKEKIEQLTKDKEELANIAQRRLIEIGRTATSAREEGYKEAIKDAQDEKTVKDLLAIEREAYKNTLDARRVKRALLEELNKREIEGKQEMLKALNEAKSTQEIYKAAQGLMGNLYKAYEESEAGKAQRRKTDIPKTNWNKVKLTAIDNFKKIAQQADAEIEQARALDRQASVMRTKGQKPDEKQQAQFDTARNKILKGYGLKFAKALKEAFYGIEHIDNIWLDKEANYLGAQYARGTNILGAELDRFIERAQKRQAKNYKKYIAEKIEKMIEGGYKVKDGQKQKGKFDYLTNKLFEDLKGIGNMDRTFAKKELERRNQIIKNTPSDAEAALQIFGLEGDADNANPALADNMRLENMYLSFKAGKMNKEEMAAQKEYFQAEGLPDTIGDDEWYYVSAQLLGTFYKILNERRKAALEGKILQSMKRAFEEEREREDFANSVKKNGKAGVIKKMYLSVIANWESMLNTLSNAIFKEKFSLLLEEAKAETRVNEKMTEILQTAKKVLRADNAEMKKWIDSLDDKVITVKNRIESKRKALSETDGHLKGKLEMLDQFSKLLGQKNEIVLKDALSIHGGPSGKYGDFNLKVVYDGKEGGLKRIYDRGGLDAVMRSVALLPKGGLDEYSKTAQKYRKDGVILLKNSNDFAAVLKYSEPGGKGTYTLVDFIKYDGKGNQIAGYGLDGKNNVSDLGNDSKKTSAGMPKNNDEDKFFHAAAMYKTPHKNFKSFYETAQNSKGKKQFYYTYTTEGGINIDIPSDTVLHDNKHPEMSADEWKKGLSYIDNIEDSLYTKPRFSNGIGILLKVNAENSKYGAEITLTPSGRIILNTLFKSTDEGINAWIEKEKENAVVSAPLRRGQALKNNRDVISGHSPIHSLADILKNANTQKETFFQGNDESLQEKIDRTNQDNNVNSKEIESEIRKAALNAAANVINPFVDTVYAPVEQELTKGEIIDIYNTCKNDIGYARYENQYGYDQLTEMFALLSQREKQIADMWQKTVEGGYDEVNDVFIKQYGLDMGKPENYWPFTVDRIESEIDMLGSNYREASRPGMTKSRTRGTLVEMKPQNPVEKLYRHYNTAMKYVETSEKVSRLRRILRHSIIKKVVKENFGEDALKLLYELLDNSTLGANKNKVKYYHDGIMNWLTNNYVKAAIALKPSITLKQLISVVNYSENMPAGEWAKGFADAISHPKETIDFMMDDPYLKTRFENGSQNEALMRALAKDFGKNKTVKQLNSWSNMLAINVRLGDIGAIIFGGKPYIDYLMKEKGMSKEDAFKQFRLDTLRSQQASMRSALSRLQAAEMNWLMRALFAFKNTGNQYVRKCADAIISYKRGEMSAKQLAKTLAIYGVINQYLYVALGSLGLFAAAGAGFDDDDKNKQMWAEFMQWPAQNFGFLPILDDAVNQASYRLVNLALDGKAGPVRNPETPILKDIYGAVRTLQKDDLAFEDVINALAPVAQTGTGLPFNYGVNAGKAAGELYKGEFTKTALMLGGWSEKRAQAVAGEE